FAVVGERLVRAGVAQAEEEPEEAPAENPASSRWDEPEMPASDLADLGTPLHVCEPTAEAQQAFAGAVVCFVLAAVVAPATLYAVFVAKAFQSPSLPPAIVLILAGVFVIGLVA